MAYTPSYVNFSRYLDANRGAASQAAQGLADDVTRQGSELDGQLGTQVQDFNTASAAGVLAPVRAVGHPNDAAYTGPQSLSQFNAPSYTSLLDKADGLGSRASDLGSESGVRTALQARAGTAPYSTGASRFDGALVSAAGAPALSDAASRYGTLSQRVRDADTASGVTAAANTAIGEQNLAGHQAAAAQWRAADKTIGQRYAAPPAALMPEKDSARDARKLNPLAAVSPGAANAVQDSLKNFDTYRDVQERKWNREHNPLGMGSNRENPYSSEHIGKSKGVLGRWQ